MSLLEAMSCGCPVVTMATCAIPEIINHGENGFLVNSQQEVNQYTKELFSNEELRKSMGEKARETILDKFSIEGFSSQWNELLEGVL